MLFGSDQKTTSEHIWSKWNPRIMQNHDGWMEGKRTIAP